MGMEFPFGAMKVPWNQIEAVVAQHRKCTKCHGTVHFKWLILSYVNLTSIKK